MKIDDKTKSLVKYGVIAGAIIAVLFFIEADIYTFLTSAIPRSVLWAVELITSSVVIVGLIKKADYKKATYLESIAYGLAVTVVYSIGLIVLNIGRFVGFTQEGYIMMIILGIIIGPIALLIAKNIK